MKRFLAVAILAILFALPKATSSAFADNLLIGLDMPDGERHGSVLYQINASDEEAQKAMAQAVHGEALSNSQCKPIYDGFKYMIKKYPAFKRAYVHCQDHHNEWYVDK